MHLNEVAHWQQERVRHVAVVVEVRVDKILTLIEGNTSPDPADVSQDSEGDGVYRRHRDPAEYPGVAVDVA